MAFGDEIAQLDDFQKEKVRHRLFDPPDPFTGIDITFCFPEKLELKNFSLTGIVPRKGDTVYIRNWGIINPDSEYNYARPLGGYHGGVSPWRVKEVLWSCTVPGNDKEELVHGSTYRVEVYLVPIKDKIFFGWRCWRRRYWRVKRFIENLLNSIPGVWVSFSGKRRKQ